MDADNWFVDSAEETQEDRTYWFVKACPLENECSTKSWKSAGCVSFVSEDDDDDDDDDDEDGDDGAAVARLYLDISLQKRVRV